MIRHPTRLRRCSPFHRFVRCEAGGGGVIEFVIMLPMLMFIFMASAEAGLYTVRQILLDRAVERTMRDLGLGNILDRVAVRQEQNVAEGHFLPWFTLEGGHGEDRAFFDPVLLPASADDCVHGWGPSVQKKSPCPPDTT